MEAELAQKYMPDDFRYGHGVQKYTLDDYFKTRDLTVNEALVLNGALVISNFAYNDLQENIIRPTYYEMKRADEVAPGRLALRALLMQTTLEEVTESYPTIEDMNIASNYVGNFEVAVALNKAMSRGAQTAERFTELLAEYEIIPAKYGGQPKKTARYMKSYLVPGFEFRDNADQRMRERDDWSVENLPVEMGMKYNDKAVRQALKEWGVDDLGAERKLGHYTQEELDEINRVTYKQVG